MKNHKQRDILLALGLTLGVGLLLYFLARPTKTPRIARGPLHASWWDNFNKGDWIADFAGAPFNPDGIQLSRIHDLGAPVAGAQWIEAATLASDGRLFGVAFKEDDDTSHLFVYDPLNNQMMDLGSIAEQANIFKPLLVNPNRQEAYVGISCWDNTCDSHLLVYNFQSMESRRIPMSFANKHSYMGNQVITKEGLIYGITGGRLFRYDPQTDEVNDLALVAVDNGQDGIQEIVLDADENLHGYIRDKGWFKYQPTTDNVTWVQEWSQSQDRHFILNLDGNIYLYNVSADVLYTYDPHTDMVTKKYIDFGKYRAKFSCFDSRGILYVQYDDYRLAEPLLRYNLEEGTTSVLENLDRGYESLIADIENRVYLFNRGSHTEDGSAHLMVYQPDTFISKGILTSTLIQPHALMVTHTLAATGIPALAWGNDGALYGVSGNPSGIIRYDPQRLEPTALISYPLSSVCQSCTPQTVITDESGRLIVGVRGSSWTPVPEFAKLMIYDPEESTVVTTTIPISGAQEILALASAPDGTLYGSTDRGAYLANGGYAHLFRYDPTLNAVIDLGMPFTNTEWTIRALAVTSNGKIYGIGGPATLSTLSHTTLHFPGSRLFVYDPATQIFSFPGPDKDSRNRMRALLAGPDGKVYIGMEVGEESGLHIYDPANDKWIYWFIEGRGSNNIGVQALTWGADGLIYGSTSTQLFTYDPRYPDRPPVIIGTLNRTFTHLLAGSNGTIYGTIGYYNSYFSTATELIAFRTDCAAGRIGAWERVTWEADTPRGTAISIDVLDEKGAVLVRNIRNGGSLADTDPLIYPSVRLQATLTTRNPQVSPVLKSWQVEYTFECQQ